LADVVDPITRSRMMSGIRNRDTRPEIVVRHGLHRRGLRFRLHVRKLPGCPDLVFPKYGAVVTINGCFWHKHSCSLFRWPATRSAFWKDKLQKNFDRDQRNQVALSRLGWRVMVVWECALKNKSREEIEEVLDVAYRFIVGNDGFCETAKSGLSK
jgi:DNA mismatch endonuclease (patch repair protein)